MTTPAEVRTVDVATWSADRLAARAAADGVTISLCFPCRNEAATIGRLVTASHQALVEWVPLLHELIVVDDRSTDATATVAAEAGATVVPIDDVHADHGTGHGKGNALWASLVASSGDVVVWCDGDVSTFSPDWVVHLAAPLVLDATVSLVKPTYHRPTDGGGGGRTTELVARPLLRLLAPELAGLAQPLAGEYAVRRSALAPIPIVQDWGAEIAMVLDVAARDGVGSVVQVELGERRHRHQTLEDLSVQATEVLAAALERLPTAGARGIVSPTRPPLSSSP